MATQKLIFSLFLADTFWTNWPIDLIFGMLVGHYISRSFEYQGHGVNVKVMATQKLIFFLFFLADTF